MIGQRELINKITAQIERGKFPRVSILIGEKGSGKKTLTHLIGRKMGLIPYYFDADEDCFSKVREYMYELDVKGIYVSCDCDDLTEKGMDSIREIINNLPDDVYFIITCELLDNIPADIKSKAVTYMMDSYSDDDKFDYLYECFLRGPLTEDDESFIVETASNLGEICEMLDHDVREFKVYVNYVLNSLMQPPCIPSEFACKIALSGENDKYPIRLFLRAFMAICGDKMQVEGNSLMYCRFIAITEEALQDNIGSSESSLDAFKSWESKIREEYEKFRD